MNIEAAQSFFSIFSRIDSLSALFTSIWGWTSLLHAQKLNKETFKIKKTTIALFIIQQINSSSTNISKLYRSRVGTVLVHSRPFGLQHSSTAVVPLHF